MKQIANVEELIEYLKSCKDFKLKIFRVPYESETNFLSSDIDINYKNRTVVIDGQYKINKGA